MTAFNRLTSNASVSDGTATAVINCCESLKPGILVDNDSVPDADSTNLLNTINAREQFHRP